MYTAYPYLQAERNRRLHSFRPRRIIFL